MKTSHNSDQSRLKLWEAAAVVSLVTFAAASVVVGFAGLAARHLVLDAYSRIKGG
jgi:hypothetical protein